MFIWEKIVRFIEFEGIIWYNFKEIAEMCFREMCFVAESKDIKNSELTDISTKKINPNDSVEKKTKDFIKQIKNPYSFKCGAYEVNIKFAETDKKLEDCLSNCIETL